MANNNTSVKEGYEKIFIPRGKSREDPNFFVSINGKNYLLPRGKESIVPSFVADEIRRANEAENNFFELSDKLAASR